ncbi:hypothetical protein D3C80_1639970 [compost metagenome]
MPPQSANGGWMPRPRNDRPATKRKVKQKRRPNSAISGGSVFGRISRQISQPRPSPRRRAVSAYSSTLTPCATMRAKRNTRVESSNAMVMIRTGSDEPSACRMTSAEMSTGMHMTVSTMRERIVSTQPPKMAARKPSGTPTLNDRSDAASETPIDICAPKSKRESMSRPF